MTNNKISINRAPVLTLWAAIVAERLGHDRQEALTLGKAVAGLNAQSKGRRIGIYPEKTGEEKEKEKKEARTTAQHTVAVLGRAVPVVKTPRGPRAAIQGEAIDPESVQAYLEQKFGERLEEARLALEQLARHYTPQELESRAYDLYEKFRPEIPEGKKGWGAKGELDLDHVRSLGK
ncbi:MAG TPA: hypothetical protein VF784_13930 [Anaerolineales bacterium]